MTTAEHGYQTVLEGLTDIDLCVLHAIFSKGETVADPGVEEVYRRLFVALFKGIAEFALLEDVATVEMRRHQIQLYATG